VQNVKQLNKNIIKFTLENEKCVHGISCFKLRSLLEQIKCVSHVRKGPIDSLAARVSVKYPVECTPLLRKCRPELYEVRSSDEITRSLRNSFAPRSHAKLGLSCFNAQKVTRSYRHLRPRCFLCRLAEVITDFIGNRKRRLLFQIV